MTQIMKESALSLNYFISENQVSVVPESFRVLKSVKFGTVHGEIIGKLVSSRYYVHRKTLISDLAYDFDIDKTILAVGVVNDENELAGIIVRKDLFDIFGRPYGSDILKHKKSDRVMRKVISFGYDRNIFSISDEIGQFMQNSKTEYFALTFEEKYFAGIFSTRDILVYLSNITQADINLARNIQKV